jgi:hypothetical protein
MEFAPQRTLPRIPGPIGLFLLFLLVVVPTGCGHVSPARTGRTSDVAGTAGIVTARFLPEVRLDLPGKGRVDGAVRGAGRGFLAGAEIPLRILAEGMSGCSSKECGYVAIGILAVATATGAVGAVVGGVHGAIEAMPAREARKIEEATEGFANLRIQEILADRVLEAGTESGACRYILLPDASWSAPDDEVDYRSRAGEGFDSILEIGVDSVGFKGTQWGSDPPLSVFLTVRVRRYGGKDGKLLGVENLVYEGGERKFAEWMADGASPAEEEFEQGYREIADRIVGRTPCD